MLEFNNSAGRLLLLIERLKRQPANWSSQIIWRKVLFLEDRELSNDAMSDDISWNKVMTALTQLYWLVCDVEEDVKEREPEDHHVYLTELNTLKRIFSPSNLAAEFTPTHSLITGELRANLRHCARLLDREIELEETELLDVAAAATELFELIKATQMPTKLRRTLLSLVEKVRQAVALYDIVGAKGLDDALKSLVGNAWVHRHEIGSLPSRQALAVGFDKLWTKLALVAAKAGHVNKIADLTAKAVPLLEWIAGKVG